MPVWTTVGGVKLRIGELPRGGKCQGSCTLGQAKAWLAQNPKYRFRGVTPRHTIYGQADYVSVDGVNHYITPRQ